MTSPSTVMEFLIHYYSCEKEKKENVQIPKLLEGIHVVHANKTPNSHNATP